MRDYVIDCWKRALILGAVLLLGLWASRLCAETIYAFEMNGCPYCEKMQPALSQLAREGYDVRRVNRDADASQRQLTEEYGVARFPTIVVIADGREIDRMVGFAPLDKLKERLAKQRQPVAKPNEKPTPAWRYETATGYRAAIVRIYCTEEGRTRSIGVSATMRHRRSASSHAWSRSVSGRITMNSSPPYRPT